jgi:hypothetical protein
MSYLSMQADFMSILNRDDCTTTLANTFLTQAMTQIERECRLPCMERIIQFTAPATTPMNSVSIPSDFLEPIDMYVQSQSGHHYCPPAFNSSDTWFPLKHSSYRQALLVNQRDVPKVYSRYTGQFYFSGAIPPKVMVQLVYYGQFTPIVDQTQDNEATASIPDLIIYKALGSYAGDYFQHESGPQWEARYQQLLQSAQLLAQDADWKGGPMQIAPAHGGGSDGGWDWGY